jgi:hypothetical protein
MRTSVGSYDNNDPIWYVSATHIGGGHQYVYQTPINSSTPGYGHGDYLGDGNDGFNAHMWYCDWCTATGHTWYDISTQPHSLHLMLIALLESDW